MSDINMTDNQIENKEVKEKTLTINKETTESIKRPNIKTDIKTGRPVTASCKATGSCCDAGLSR